MTANGIAKRWSSDFGLALTPLFEVHETPDAKHHHVLLDGGHGTFALSVLEDEIWREPNAAAWAWSSNVPHHVTVTKTKVAVVRWDRPADPRVFDRASVDRNCDEFYRFLSSDRLRSTKTVVDHLLGLFRRIRSLSFAAGVADERTTDLFLYILADLISSDGQRPSAWGLADDVEQLYHRLSPTGVATASNEIRRATGSLQLLQLHPNLAVRHAGGQLFQEAHFELLRVPPIDLFGYVGAPHVKEVSRGGAHFTPPALARSIVELSLANFHDLSRQDRIRICDPACGSGAFLHEALRALRRLGFSGGVVITGRDISAPAIAMARFVLHCAIRDWSPPGGIELDLELSDSLNTGAIPDSDIIVMNPPFVSWGTQTPDQRSRLREALGGHRPARGDLSMGFVLRALEALRPGGVLGTLFPASLLSLESAADWRDRLIDVGDIRLLASIGDYGLFTHALVQVAYAIVRKNGIATGSQELTALVTTNESLATGDALRWLRKIGATPPPVPITEASWSIFSLQPQALRSRPTWRFPSPAAGRALRLLEDALLPSIGELFDVRQGIQTGFNKALLLTETEWLELPTRERAFFRRVTMSDSIQNAAVHRPYYVFFPHAPKGPIFRDEKAVRSSLPEYFKRFLSPYKGQLAGRATIRRSGRQDWWGLMEPRSWSWNSSPRIISKYFGAEGSFYGDYEAAYLPVMGFAWFPKPVLDSMRADSDAKEILSAYVGLLNSNPFAKFLEIYSPHVAGGQFDLSPRYVNIIPMPNLAELNLDPVRGRSVQELAKLGAVPDLADPQWRARINHVVSELYGSEIIAAL